MLILELLTGYKSLHHRQAELHTLTELQWIIPRSPSERRATDFRELERFIWPDRPSRRKVWSWHLLRVQSPYPLNTCSPSFFFSLWQWESAEWQQRHTHTLNCSALATPSSFTIVPFPSSQQPTFICSVVNSLAVKLKDWLCCLSSFYLLPWFIFISTMKGRTERHPEPLFCLRQADLATESKDVSSCVSHAIVSQRHCNITVLREMIAVEFYGLLQWERWSWWPQSNGIHLLHTTGFNNA